MARKQHENIRKILIIRLSSIGDITLTTELVRLVRSKFKDAQIDYLTSKQFICLLKHNPNIDNIVSYNKSKSKKKILEERDSYLKESGIEKYDLILDLHNNFRSRQWTLDIGKSNAIEKFWLEKIAMVYLNQKKKLPTIPIRYLETLNKFDIESDDKGLEIWLPDEKDYYPPLSKNANGTVKSIGIAPGAHHFTKRWPSSKFAALISDLIVKYEGAEIHLFGGTDDISISNELEAIFKSNIKNHVGKLSLIESAQEIDKCDLFISNDTGLMHIAAARKVPLVAIFGSTVPALGFQPYGTQFQIVENESLPCRPCSHIGRDTCPKKHFNCMNEITPKDVIDGVEGVLQGVKV